jgi:hypothetical protein
LYSPHYLRLIEDEADLLLALLRCPPAGTAIGGKDEFNGKRGIFRR